MNAGAIGAVLLALWIVAGSVLVARRRREPVGLIVLGGTAVGVVGVTVPDAGGPALALLCGVGSHLLAGMPDGRLATPGRRALVCVVYAAAAGVAAFAWSRRPSVPTVALLALAAVALVAGFGPMVARYGGAGTSGQRRIRWFAWAIVVAGVISAIALGLHVLVGWPLHLETVAAASTALLPLALVAGVVPRFDTTIDPLLVRTISLAGLIVVVIAVYVAIVLGLGRVPEQRERTLLVLSMVAAGVCALLYFPTHARLTRFAKRIVYRERHAPDDAIRQFGTRLTRAIPLDELLLQLAESLRKTFDLTSAEVWTLTGDSLQLMVSDPERPRHPVRLTGAETDTVARAGISGPAWIRVWLPSLLDGREESVIRLAPIAHSGELLGVLIVERPDDAAQFAADQEATLVELARQVGLTLHNVQLDSALQASLDEVRRQARELQASRGRIVAASDAARRTIERNLHDGAQQHLVALAVKVRLARQLAEKDPARAMALLEELGGDVEDTLQELRDLAHGIYPPLLADKGLPEALASAARRATLPTTVHANGTARYPQEVEAAVYFCCLEALQNAGKYAGDGATVDIAIDENEGALLFAVTDHGKGFDVTSRARGAGFTNMSDRLGAVGGSLRVESTLGVGTRVSGVIPLASPPEGAR
jgi:signal transduction histidine kinase